MKRVVSIFLLASCFYQLVTAQTPVTIRDSVDQYIFSFAEIEYLEDKNGSLTLDEIRNPDRSNDFQASKTFSPRNYNRDSYYWYRVRIQHDPHTTREWQIEFFDQTIDHLDVYMPDGDGGYIVRSLGDNYPFYQRFLKHKNFVVNLPEHLSGVHTYYFRLQSRQQADVLIVLRPEEYFINYALDEYFFFGVFYGMILVFCFYNLLMFAAVHERHYLYYIMYLLGIGLYEMSADGIAFQYLWPEAMEWNQYAPGFSLYLASTAALFFAGSLLNLRKQYTKLL